MTSLPTISQHPVALQNAEDTASAIPWLDLIRFHRAIVQRAEAGFWTMDASEAESDRWTSLTGFEPANLDGPWPLDPALMRSPAWRRQLELGQIDSMFLGGPGFLGRARVGKESVECWQPLFYRDVQSVAVEGGVELRAVSEEWLLSPLVHQLLDRLQLRPDLEPDVLNARVMQRVRESIGKGSLQLAIAFADSLFAYVPELREHLRFDPGSTFSTPPDPWILFAPPSKVGLYNQQLVRDYDAMERFLLSSSSENTGGLALLRPRSEPVVEAHADVLPFIPLNAAQERAVATMLAGKPVTVVSGPPGCGKSQVVVSLLLNAWAQGQSVLFASNNNKAVDVVRDRLRAFDAVHPVALRAGNTTVNNVTTALRRIAQTAGSRDALAADLNKLRAVRAEAREERQQVVRLLDTGNPQRIAEALDAALRTHGAFLTRRAKIDERDVSMAQRLRDLAGRAAKPEEVEQVLDSTRAWISEVTTLRQMSAQEDSQRTHHAAEARQAATTAHAALVRCGVDADHDGTEEAWQCLRDVYARLTSWLTAAHSALGASEVEVLRDLPWETQYDQWTSHDDASETAGVLYGLASSVEVETAQVPNVVCAVADAQAIGKAAWQSLVKCGWAERQRLVDVDTESLDAWLAMWARFISTPRGLLGMSGALTRRHIRKELEALEGRFRDSLPLEVWRKIGPLDDQARHSLSEVVEELARHQDARRKEVLATRRLEDLTTRLDQLRASVESQAETGVLDVLNLEQWLAVPPRLRQRAEESTAAANAWTVRARREAAARAVREAGESWIEDVHQAKELASWISGPGKAIDRELGALATTQTTDAAKAAAAAIAREELKLLREALADAFAAERKRHDSQLRHDVLPVAIERISQTWCSRPDSALTIGSASNEWPDVSEHEARLDLVESWRAEWRPYAEVERPKRLQRAELEREVSIGRLREATALLPESSEAQGVRARVEQVLEDHSAQWPVGELRDRFMPFLPERLRLRLSTLDDDLSRTAMMEAGSRWGERLASEISALNAVDRLQQAAGPNGQGDLSRHPDHFRQALPVAPVWITTAQSTRAIPLAPQLFDLVVIDEASQCTLTNLLPMLFRARRLVVIGDPQQLPAITAVQASEERLMADQFGVREFIPEFGHDRRDVYTVAREALPGAASDVVMLDEHYRSDPLIIGFSNRHVYQHQLRLRRSPGKRPGGVEPGVHGIHVAGTAQRPQGGGWRNEREAREVVDRVRALHASGVSIEAIGVVTPFTGQKVRIETLLEAAGLAAVHVNTAFGYQGDERDVIVFSPVVAPGMGQGSVNWVEQPPNLLNVALTRARDALFVVANFEYLSQQRGLLRDLAVYVQEVEALRGGHPAELALFSWMMMEGWMPVVHQKIGLDTVSFVLAGRPGVRVAVVVRLLSYAESAKTEVERAREANLEAAGYRVLEVIARDAIETPAAVLQRIRSAM